MPSSTVFKDFVLEQLYLCTNAYHFSARKMFGEFCIYIHSNGEKKALFFIFDDTVFLKQNDKFKDILKDNDLSPPFKGAKPWYVIDIENLELLEMIIKDVFLFLEPLKIKNKKKIP